MKLSKSKIKQIINNLLKEVEDYKFVNLIDKQIEEVTYNLLGFIDITKEEIETELNRYLHSKGYKLNDNFYYELSK